MTSFILTEIALDLLEYKFYDPDGNHMPDLQSLLELSRGNPPPKNWEPLQPNLSSVFFPEPGQVQEKEVKHAENQKLAEDEPSSSDEVALTIDMDRDDGNDQLEVDELGQAERLVQLNEYTQFEYNRLKFQVEQSEMLFVQQNQDLIKKNKLQPEKFLKHFHTNGLAVLEEENAILRSLFKTLQNDLTLIDEAKYDKYFKDVVIGKNTLQNKLSQRD